MATARSLRLLTLLLAGAGFWLAGQGVFAQVQGDGQGPVDADAGGKPGGVEAAAATLRDRLEACARLFDTLARVNCYDAVVGRPDVPPSLSDLPSSAGPPPLANPPSSRELPSLAPDQPASARRNVELDELVMPGRTGPVTRAMIDVRRSLGTTLADRWELDDASDRGRFLVRPYKPILVMPVEWTSRRNPLPTSANPANTVIERQDVRSAEAKFQLSLKSKLWEDMFDSRWDLWAGYTQSSYWQVYNSGASRPFRETNYEPEVMAVSPVSGSLLGWQLRMVGIGLNHQSNGRSEPESRSWNRIIGMVGLERKNWMMMVRPWWRIRESAADDDNPDINDHIGRADLLLVRKSEGHELSFLARHTLRAGSRSRGSLQIDYAFPISSYLKANLQVFTGYGASLIDYNLRQTRVGLGISLVSWL